jgi:hypothetical protein
MADEVVSASFGDIIGVYRGPTKHYGVYINDHSVVHYAPYIDEFEKYHYIRETTLDRFLHGKTGYFICIFPETNENEPIDVLAAPFRSLTLLIDRLKLLELIRQSPYYRIYSPRQTAQRALSKVGEREYSPSISNCEHFVVWCKTGITETSKVKCLLGLLPNVPAVLSIN